MIGTSTSISVDRDSEVGPKLELAGKAGCNAELIAERFRRDMLTGLARREKAVPCKYFYDEEGARLFEAICELEEYYPTRTETSILQQNIDEIVALVGSRANLVDLGSGSGQKTRLLLKHLDRPASYCPVDVALEQLLECSARLAGQFPSLEVQPVCADYTDPFDLPAPPPGSGSTTLFFPGSTIGNFGPGEAAWFLRRMAGLCGPAGGLLIGVDLRKSVPMLNSAYNDSKGITAQFNLNLLARANRELQAGFDLGQFRHHAFYNEAAGRIEMHLVSRRRQRVPVDGTCFTFARDESVLTEHSYKYTVGLFHELAAKAGLEVVRSWTDERQWFSVHYLKARQHGAHHAGQA